MSIRSSAAPADDNDVYSFAWKALTKLIAIGLCLRRGLKPIIFLVNNNGYAIERLILGPGSSYNDINQWRYADAASFFDTQDQAIAYKVQTEDELEDALAAASDREALVLIELVMSRLDAPGPLVNFAQRCAQFNFPELRRV